MALGTSQPHLPTNHHWAPGVGGASVAWLWVGQHPNGTQQGILSMKPVQEAGSGLPGLPSLLLLPFSLPYSVQRLSAALWLSLSLILAIWLVTHPLIVNVLGHGYGDPAVDRAEVDRKKQESAG